MSQRVSNYPRRADECYETPAWVSQAAAPYLRGLCVHLWDPANGPGSKLANALRAEGFRVIATNDDFLQKSALPDAHIEAIITNPPYGTSGRLACAFIQHALTLVPVVAMLLRVDFDSGKTRTPLFGGCAAFAGKIVLLDRIAWFEREGAAPSDNHAWFIWDKRRHQRLPTISYARRPC
jgi:hypothetical protein